MRWLDRIPCPLLIAAAAFMLGAPFVPEPHLLEKARLLADGRLTRPLDVFDVFWHLAPAVLLGLKLALARKAKAPVPGQLDPTRRPDSRPRLPVTIGPNISARGARASPDAVSGNSRPPCNREARLIDAYIT